jgi:hypothetical protein
MGRFALRYLGHRPGAPLSYFTGASVTLTVGMTFDVPGGGLVVGRRASADLRIASAAVAPHHARLCQDAEGLRVIDLGSTNGTEVNGAPMQSTTLCAGDRVTFAKSFDFEVVEIESAPPRERP